MSVFDYSVISASFMLGLLGSMHCVGMCGSIVGLMTHAARQQNASTWLRYVKIPCYHIGRILSYSLAGFIAGSIGSTLIGRIGMDRAHTIAQLLSGVFMLLLGLSLGGFFNGLAVLDPIGNKLWKLLAPLAKRSFTLKSPLSALFAGAVWGWLPCGLVYTALMLSLPSHCPTQGALAMASFGIGTLPLLWVVGHLSGRAFSIAQHTLLRRVIGLIIVGFAILTFTGLAIGTSHHSSHQEIQHQSTILDLDQDAHNHEQG